MIINWTVAKEDVEAKDFQRLFSLLNTNTPEGYGTTA